MIFLPEKINLGGCLEYNGNKYDVDIEKENFVSVAYAFDNSNEMELTIALEKAVLKTIQELENDILKIHIIDFDITRKFRNLNRLKHIENLINYVNITNIKQTLSDIENTVIDYNNNYLNDEYADICEYNKDNGAFSLSYNIIIINFDYLEINNEHYISLNKLLKHGRKAGVLFFFLFNGASFANEIAESKQKSTFNNRQKIDFFELILNNATTIYKSKERYLIQNTTDKVKTAFQRFPYTPIANDIEQITNLILDKERKKAKENKTFNFISIPIGNKGKQTYYFELGLKSGSYHAFIGGTTGMGKSNFINNIIVQVAEKYSSDEIRLVLLDLKGAGGTEFQFYKEHPNVETLVLTSRIDIVKKVITDFTNELDVRTQLFNDNEVRTVEEYKAVTGKKLPYKLMIIDEVQELFSTDWKTTNLFNGLLDKIGRQGRSYGIFMVLSTQSLTDVNISNSVLNNLKLRISFKLSNLNDCRKIMDARGNNELPYDIEPYEIVYNNNLGKLQNNQHFLTTEIKTNTIKERLKNCKHKTTLPIEQKIYSFDTSIEEVDKNISDDKVVIGTRKEEVNLDDY